MCFSSVAKKPLVKDWEKVLFIIFRSSGFQCSLNPLENYLVISNVHRIFKMPERITKKTDLINGFPKSNLINMEKANASGMSKSCGLLCSL